MLASKHKLQYLLVGILMIIMASANVAPAAAACGIGSPVVGTDKADYGAFETATISGSGFGCGEVLSVKVISPDGSVLSGNGAGSPGPDVVTTDSNGEFTMSYTLSGTIPGSPTSLADGTYAGQVGAYTVEVISSDGVVLASSTFTDQSQLGQPVPASVIVTYNGLEWVWASPCALNGCTSGILIGKDGFNFATQAQWTLRPPVSAFRNPDICASPWFDLTFNHCDWSDAVNGFYGSAPVGGLPAGISGNTPVSNCCWETWLVRGPSNATPTASTGGPYSGNEGSAIAMSGASASDPDGDTLTYSWGVDSALCSFDYLNTLNPNLTCTDNGSFTATLTVSDNINAAVTSDASVTVSNVAPTASLGNDGPIGEGGSAVVSFSGASDPSSDDTGAGFHYAFDCNGGSLAAATYATSGTGDSTSCAFADNGSYIVSGKIVDKDNGATEYTTVVTVNNVAPTIAISGATNVNEGSPYSLTLDAVTDPGTDTVASYIVHWGDGNTDSYSSNGVQTHTYSDGPNSYAITVNLTDEDGTFLDRANALSVTVNNVAPTLGGISIDQVLVPVGTSINTSASFTDPGTLDTHTAAWDWGDSTTSAGTISETGGNGTASESHSYSTSGVYTLRLTVTDKDGAASNESVYQYVVVYDPNGGLVIGSGWINSPAGAYAADPSLTGKVIFSFVAKYKKGQSIPDGNIEFQFKTGDLHFHSSSYQWLMVAGKKAKFKTGDLHFHSSSYQWLVVAGKKAQIKGEGTINRSGHYGFMLTVIDGQINGRGGVDKFRLRIWDMDNGNAVVYDNQMGAPVNADPTTALGGGNIIIHK